MMGRLKISFVRLWNELWFFRLNVVVAIVGTIYLLTR